MLMQGGALALVDSADAHLVRDRLISAGVIDLLGIHAAHRVRFALLDGLLDESPHHRYRKHGVDEATDRPGWPCEREHGRFPSSLDREDRYPVSGDVVGMASPPERVVRHDDVRAKLPDMRHDKCEHVVDWLVPQR